MHGRRTSSAVIALGLLAIAITACSGSVHLAKPETAPSPTERPTSSPSATPSPHASATPSPTPSPTSPSTSACVSGTAIYPSSGGAVPVPAPSGYSVTLTFPSNNATPGQSFPVRGCGASSPPAAVAGSEIPTFLASVGGTAVFYVETTLLPTPVTVDTSSVAGMSATFPSSVVAHATGSFYLTGCDEATCNLQPITSSISGVIGPVPLTGNSIAIDTSSALLSAYEPPNNVVPGGHTVIGVIYTSPYAPGLQYRKLQSLRSIRR